MKGSGLGAGLEAYIEFADGRRLNEYEEEIRTIGEGGGGMLAWAECEQGKEFKIVMTKSDDLETTDDRETAEVKVPDIGKLGVIAITLEKGAYVFSGLEWPATSNTRTGLVYEKDAKMGSTVLTKMTEKVGAFHFIPLLGAPSPFYTFEFMASRLKTLSQECISKSLTAIQYCVQAVLFRKGIMTDPNPPATPPSEAPEGFNRKGTANGGPFFDLCSDPPVPPVPPSPTSSPPSPSSSSSSRNGSSDFEERALALAEAIRILKKRKKQQSAKQISKDDNKRSKREKRLRELDLTKSDDDDEKTPSPSETTDAIGKVKSGTPAKIKEEKQ
ncbi:hypothetical protein EHS25_004533 [Saitozyma podzolica]|uniref:Uncharacterized protein n=1 Tax=Saitozyma podzolica TaxID=1890683 RepID=A0A427YUB7_9TREE|nr:hypothetical protein EHS25_004533 [Saitozyma podzolica]